MSNKGNKRKSRSPNKRKSRSTNKRKSRSPNKRKSRSPNKRKSRSPNKRKSRSTNISSNLYKIYEQRIKELWKQVQEGELSEENCKQRIIQLQNFFEMEKNKILIEREEDIQNIINYITMKYEKEINDLEEHYFPGGDPKTAIEQKIIENEEKNIQIESLIKEKLKLIENLKEEQDKCDKKISEIEKKFSTPIEENHIIRCNLEIEELKLQKNEQQNYILRLEEEHKQLERDKIENFKQLKKLENIILRLRAFIGKREQKYRSQIFSLESSLHKGEEKHKTEIDALQESLNKKDLTYKIEVESLQDSLEEKEQKHKEEINSLQHKFLETSAEKVKSHISTEDAFEELGDENTFQLELASSLEIQKQLQDKIKLLQSENKKLKSKNNLEGCDDVEKKLNSLEALISKKEECKDILDNEYLLLPLEEKESKLKQLTGKLMGGEELSDSDMTKLQQLSDALYGDREYIEREESKVQNWFIENNSINKDAYIRIKSFVPDQNSKISISIDVIKRKSRIFELLFKQNPLKKKDCDFLAAKIAGSPMIIQYDPRINIPEGDMGGPSLILSMHSADLIKIIGTIESRSLYELRALAYFFQNITFSGTKKDIEIKEDIRNRIINEAIKKSQPTYRTDRNEEKTTRLYKELTPLYPQNEEILDIVHDKLEKNSIEEIYKTKPEIEIVIQ